MTAMQLRATAWRPLRPAGLDFFMATAIAAPSLLQLDWEMCGQHAVWID